MRVLTVFGTRPEAIKMIPVIKALHETDSMDTCVCVTAQHRHMLDQVLKQFEIKPDFDLDLMRNGQDISDVTCAVLHGMRRVFQSWRPDIILVHGDTSTTLSASLAAYYAKIRIGHIEAGLRTYKKYAPWPEEMNRHLTDTLADIHFVPTIQARQNLLHEGVPECTIHITGNTVIDALLDAVRIVRNNSLIRSRLDNRFLFINPAKHLVLVTGHRRENFGPGLENICHALVDITSRGDTQIVYPAHLNPNVQEPVHRILSGKPNIHLLEPLDYLAFVYLMDRCTLIITDSGGVQEEAPTLGKPVLVTRNVTERPEAVDAGTVKLVGTNRRSLVSEVDLLLDDPAAYQAMSHAHNPYGDGTASLRILDILKTISY